MDTLKEARYRYFDGIRKEGGIKCQCCDRQGSFYRHSILCVFARLLVYAYRKHGTLVWFRLSDTENEMHTRAHQRWKQSSRNPAGEPKHAHSASSKLCFWGLMEERPEGEHGPKGKHYRLTSAGGLFCRGSLLMHKYVHEYKGQISRYSGPMIGIKDCFNEYFDYEDYIRGSGA